MKRTDLSRIVAKHTTKLSRIVEPGEAATLLFWYNGKQFEIVYQMDAEASVTTWTSPK